MSRKRRLPDAKSRDCKQCGKTYTPKRKFWRSVFCCVKCQRTACMRPKELNGELSRQTAEKRGAIQRGRGNKKTYRKYMGRHEHRVVAENKIGRALQRSEIVHHIDGDRYNNYPENLMVVTRKEHIEIHRSQLLENRSDIKKRKEVGAV